MADSKSALIYQDLLKRISTGDLSGKINLPTETVLAAHYRCSRPTLRKAVDELKQVGYITSIKGSGAYINAPPQHERSQTSLLGIIFPNMGPGYFFDPLYNQLAQYASCQGYSLVWGGYVSPKSDMLKFDILQLCERYIAQGIQGLFFSPFEYHEKVEMLNEEILNIISHAGIPVVLIDANIKPYPAPNDFDLVSLDHIHASYMMTTYLIQQGYRRIFFFAPRNSHTTIKLRLMGYHEAMLDHHLPPEPLIEIDRDDASVSCFITEKRPDAILCSNDITAMGLINSIEKLGMKVPADIAVTGFDHLSQAMPFSRLITSIEQPIAAITQTALELMVSRIAAPQKPPSCITYPGKLVIEEST
ncbi:MAG: LacI family transcriptional regulator [Treponema sp.]|jgi:DNA-binding LacI/PurR family transcriptional regulator|nr:LacI family transcriptional regulator [Treponema sp.]